MIFTIFSIYLNSVVNNFFNMIVLNTYAYDAFDEVEIPIKKNIIKIIVAGIYI